MMDLKFLKEELAGEVIYRLDGGTKYLPTLYIKHNKNWDSWMVFDYTSHNTISNRIFKTQKDCVEYIHSYDGLSEDALSSLHNEIKESTLSTVMKSIDFGNPNTLAQVFDEELDDIIESQKQKIASIYNKEVADVQLIYTFFEGLLSVLFTKDCANKDDMTFFIFNNGMISDYPAWKKVSVAMALCHQLIEYSKEQDKQKILQKWRDSFIGKTAIDTNGIGISFKRYIENTNLVLLQKVVVSKIDGTLVADASQPITPQFLCELTHSRQGMRLEVKSIRKHISIMDEVFIIAQKEEEQKNN